jgi:hypothetical protein
MNERVQTLIQHDSKRCLLYLERNRTVVFNLWAACGLPFRITQLTEDNF